jgi:hypothetical protein
MSLLEYLSHIEETVCISQDLCTREVTLVTALLP